MPKYYVGCRPGSQHWHIIEKETDKILAVSYNVNNAKLIVEALNALKVKKEVKK